MVRFFGKIKDNVGSVNEKDVTKTKGSGMVVRNGEPTPQYSTAAEAAAKVGFPVRLPTYLPEGYKLEFIDPNKGEKTGKGFVNVLYRVPGEALRTLDLMLTDDLGFLQGGDAVQEVKVGMDLAVARLLFLLSSGFQAKVVW